MNADERRFSLIGFCHLALIYLRLSAFIGGKNEL